jgi:VWFA-related protein
MRKLLCVLFALPLVAPAQEPQPTLRTTTSEVLLDFVVRDKHGEVIRNLRPNEIQVLENRVPQSIRHFEFVGGKLTAEPLAPQPLAPETKTVAATTTGAQPAHLDVNELRDMSVVSVVIANMDPRGRKLAESAIQEFIQKELRPNTYVGVFGMGMGGLRVMQNYTNDGAKISAAVAQTVRRVSTDQPVTGELFRPQLGMGMGNDPNDVNSSMVSVPSSSTPDPIQLIDTDSSLTASQNAMNQVIEIVMSSEYTNEMQDAYSDSMRYLTSLRMLVEAQGAIPGRKVVLLFTAGMPASQNSRELLHYVISAANRANVSIYAVDTRGLNSQSDLDASRRMLTEAASASQKQFLAGNDQMVTPEMVNAGEMADASLHTDMRENLYELVSGTGGELLPDSLDLREPLRRVMEDVRTHYELSYSPSDLDTDGTFRKIEVKVSRPGARVFAREGYYAVPMLNGHQVYPFEVATLKAINTRPLLHQFGFHVAALQFRPGAAQTQLSFVFQAPARDLTIVKEGQWLKIHVDVTALVKDEKGNVVQKISRDIPYQEPAIMSDEMRRGVVSFTSPFFLAPGHYTLETAVVDRESMKASVTRTALMVTEDSGLSMSDVEVARRIDPIQGQVNPSEPLQAHGGMVTPELSGTVQPDADGKVTLYAVAYPQAPVDAPIDAMLELWRDGHLLMRSPTSDVPPDATGAASILASLKTEKLSPGQYQAQISFHYKGQKVVKTVAFTLAGTT